MSAPLLSIQNLRLSFSSENGNLLALNNISFHVNSGEIVAIVGESGSGKSITSLSILQLLPSPPAIYENGSILFSEDGNDTQDLMLLNEKALQKIRGNKISMIFQEPMTSLNPVYTCGEQVIEAILQHQSISRNAAKQNTIALFEKVKLPNPEQMLNRYPHELSGGQKQRVMIAMAMCCNPRLLIADEPTTALDVTVQKNILSLIKSLQVQEKMGVIFITHDLGVVAEIADRIIVMYKGNIVEQGASSEILNNPQHVYTRALLACRPMNHPKGRRLPVVSDFLTNTVTENTISVSNKPIALDTSSNAIFNSTPAHSKDAVLLSVKNLSVHFAVKRNFFGTPVAFTKAVDNISFDIYKGETLGLVGESGCGKTTLGRTLLRLITPTSGEILYENKNLAQISAGHMRSLRSNFQIVFQDPYSSLNPRLTIEQAITEPLMVHGLFHSQKQRKEKAVELLEKVNLEAAHLKRYPHEFSGGQRQRIGIARALALNPGFIVFDESVSALDVSVQAQVLNLLNDLKKEFGFTAIFISHDIGVVKYISDRMMVMHKGKIEEIDHAESVFHQPKSEYTKALLSAIPGQMLST